MQKCEQVNIIDDDGGGMMVRGKKFNRKKLDETVSGGKKEMVFY